MTLVNFHDATELPSLQFSLRLAFGFVAFESDLRLRKVFSHAVAEVGSSEPQGAAIGSFNNHDMVPEDVSATVEAGPQLFEAEAAAEELVALVVVGFQSRFFKSRSF